MAISQTSAGITFSRVCLSVCLSVWPSSNRKTAWAVNTKLGTRYTVLYNSLAVARHALTQKSKVKCQGHTVTQTVTVARLPDCQWHVLLCRCRRGSTCRYDCLCFLVIICYHTLIVYQ